MRRGEGIRRCPVTDTTHMAIDTSEQVCPTCRATQPWFRFECTYCDSDLPRRYSGEDEDEGEDGEVS
jgi:hypothetical protein